MNGWIWLNKPYEPDKEINYVVLGQIKDKLGETLGMDGKCFPEARTTKLNLQGEVSRIIPGGKCRKEMVPRLWNLIFKDMVKKRDHHVQETASRLVGVDYRIQWFGGNKCKDRRYMPGVEARVIYWIQTVKPLMCPTMKPLETYRSGNKG